MQHKNTSYSRIMFILTLVLLGTGLLALYSASTVQSFRIYGNPNTLLLHQLAVGGVGGLVAFFIASKLNYKYWQKYSLGLLLLSILLLILVFVPGLGFSAGGATRWIHIGAFNIQPGEVAKLAIAVYSASWLAKNKLVKHELLEGTVPLLIVCGLLAILILNQPDMGTTIALVGTAGCIILASGLSWKNIGILSLIGVLAVGVLIQLAPYRVERLQTFLNRTSDPLGQSYQINQSLVSIGSGGVWGYGYGLSRQKHNYLPEAIGDSIFAVTAEELGLVRLGVILALIIAWILVGFKIAASAPDTFSRLLAAGLTSMIALQSAINIGAITGLLPLTGIPLPFFSYGSSAMIVTLVSSGILVNIAKHAKLNHA